MFYIVHTIKKFIAILILPLLIFGTSLYGKVTTKNNVNVVYLYTPTPDEKPIHQFLFPLVSDYLVKLGTDYNLDIKKQGLSNKQINKIFVSTIYRSRMTQRNQLFDYITSNKGFKHFFSLYDKNNEQFAVEFVKIVSPTFKNKESQTLLFRSINSELDKVFKSPFKIVGNVVASNYLINYFQLNSPNAFSSSHESLEEIGEGVIETFEVDPEFIKTAEKELSKVLETKLKLSESEAQKKATPIINMIAAKSFFHYAQPILKTKKRAIFKDPIIGGALSIWFKKAPAYSKHSIPDLTDEELSKIKDVTNKRISYTFAIDLGMKTNKSKDETSIWNYSIKNNTLKTLRKIIVDEKNLTFNTKGYALTVLPEKLLTGKEENAVHIEFKITLNEVKESVVDQKTDEEEEEDPVTKKINKAIENMDLDLNENKGKKRKTFENPNEDSNQDKDHTAPKFTEKDFNTLDGKHKEQTDKSFENPKKQVEYKEKETQEKDGKKQDLQTIYS